MQQRQPSSTQGSPLSQVLRALVLENQPGDGYTEDLQKDMPVAGVDGRAGWTCRQSREQTYRTGRMSALPEAKPRANAE